MALSNIWKEPRRELIEQGIGTVVVVVMGVIDYFASVRVAAMDTDKDALPWELWMLIIPLILVVGTLILYGVSLLIHAIGEYVSDWLADRGMDPRPKQRYR